MKKKESEVKSLEILLGGDRLQIEQLLALLKTLWLKRRNEVDEQYKRTLPLGDYIVDRWEKAKTLRFGDGASVYDSVLVFGDVQVGPKTWIGPFVILDGSGGLSIGANCSISAGVQIYSHDSVKWATSGGVHGYDFSKTTIEHNCYIGPNTIIAKGVTIGAGSVVGANSYVDKSWLKGSKIAGNPARALKRS